MERTYKVKQKDLVKKVDIGSATKFFELNLDSFGPYSINYTRNGRFILIGGRKGHLATFDWSTKKLGCEFHVHETVRDVQYLHNEQMFAAAQKEYLYIYDKTGLELHRLKQHHRVNRITFLPYHFLLVSVGEYGVLRYHDVSTGQFVAGHRTKAGSCDCLTFNPNNAIVHCGHHNGTVTFWSPNVNTPLVKMLCHRGHVRSIAIDPSGRYMATCGMDAQLRVWDVRTYKPLHAYYTSKPAASMNISQRGLLSLVAGRDVVVWKDALGMKQKMPYMEHRLSAEGKSVEFCPFEDVLGVGHGKGFSSLLIPGAGEPNYDALELNPFQTKKQRQESEVKQLLEKIPSELISLSPEEILKVDQADKETLEKEKQLEEEANKAHKEAKLKTRTRGKSALHKKARRKLLERERRKKVSLSVSCGCVICFQFCVVIIILCIQ
jgi:U3 small nucleolar RNA-associated protein 7